MDGESLTSNAVKRNGGIEIDTVRDIVNSIVAGGDVNLVLVIEALKDQASIGSTVDGVRELVSHTVQEYHKDVLEAQDGLDKLSTLPPSAQKERLETLLRHLHGYEHTLRARKLLANFDKPSQAMMITEPITFVFGGEAGERQPPIHVAKAIREQKIQASFTGMDSYDHIGVMLKRDPSFPTGPLKVSIPSGTCIHPGGRIGFPSFRIPGQEQTTGRVFHVD